MSTATFTLDPAQAFELDLDRGAAGRVTARATVPFRIGQVSYSAGFPHRLHVDHPRDRQVTVQGLADAAGALHVVWE